MNTTTGFSQTQVAQDDLVLKNGSLLNGSIQTRETEMTKTLMASYTLEFQQGAVRLMKNGQSIAAAARTLGMID